MTTGVEYQVRLRTPHEAQRRFIDSSAPRKIIRAGRRGGKTTGITIDVVPRFLRGRRILYAAPTQEQVETFWWEIKRALAEPLDAGVFYKNESLHVIELPGTKQRIRAKTAWNADSLRGDFADDLIIDEWQMCDEGMWELVGAPMLLDHDDATATFIYTPPSVRSRSISKARDPLHAPKMFKAAQADASGRWATFHFSSHQNPHISKSALAEISKDMTVLAYRQEIEAEDIDEVPGALWKRKDILYGEPPHATNAEGVDIGRDLVSVVVGVDPAGSTPGGDKIGIVVCGKGTDGRGYVLDDRTIHGSPDVWASRAIQAYHEYMAGKVVAESNYGGEMVRHTLSTVDSSVPVEMVSATRGKQVRAEPIAALYEQGKVSHVRQFEDLEDQLVSWMPESGKSPNNLDALVWAMTELMVTGGSPNVRWL